jgi:hypothetical protein
MAHFAKLENNIVVDVIVVSNNELLDKNGIEQESKGITFCQSIFGGDWKQTSYNGSIRKNYAAIGFSYDTNLDAFIAPKPFSSWSLDESICQWIAPIPKPISDNIQYDWDEQAQEWKPRVYE